MPSRRHASRIVETSVTRISADISEILLTRETIEMEQFEKLLAGATEADVFGPDEPDAPALTPGPAATPERARPETARPLTPIDWIVQFGDVKADADAERVLYAAIKAIMTGTVSPDTDFARYWAAAIPAAAKCQAEGGHPES